MKNLNLGTNLFFILMPFIVLYTFIPCTLQAAPTFHERTSLNIQPTSTLIYFYSGSTLMNTEDNNGDMSTYLGRTVRTIVNVNTQSIVDSQCLFTDGKNVISQTDSTGTTVTSTQQYNPFGQPVNYNPNTNSQLSIATNPFAYDGYYYDPESGLYYLNARYYSPTLMQFISMDSYDLANRYAYCDGNPIGNEDPTGHCWLGMFLSKFVKDFINPIELNADGGIDTSTSAIIGDVLNVAGDLVTDGTGELEEKLIESSKYDFIDESMSNKSDYSIGEEEYKNNGKPIDSPPFYQKSTQKGDILGESNLLDRGDNRPIENIIQDKGFRSKHKYTPSVDFVQKVQFEGTKGTTGEYGVSTATEVMKQSTHKYRDDSNFVYLLTYNKKGYALNDLERAKQDSYGWYPYGEINLPYGIDAKHIVGYYVKSENKGYRVIFSKNYNFTLTEMPNSNNFNNGSTFTEYFRKEYLNLPFQ